MKPLQIKVISFDEAKFEYNKKIGVLTKELLTDMRLVFDPVLSYREDAESIGIQLSVNYLYKDTIILSYGIVLSLIVDEYLQERAKGHENATKFLNDVEVKKELFDLATGFFRGALAIRSKNTLVAKLFLPIFNSAEMAEKMRLNEVK